MNFESRYGTCKLLITKFGLILRLLGSNKEMFFSFILFSRSSNEINNTHLPKFSPSSKVSGRLQSFVSGIGSNKSTPSIGSPPRINNGACSLKFLYNIQEIQVR